MRRYTLRQLDTFIEVARQLSISRAASALHVSQPAVSMQLRQLEEVLGMPLYEQVGRNIVLTEAGNEVLAHAQAATAQLRQMEDAMAARRGIRKGRVDLGMVSTAKYFVPMLLVLFRRKSPDIEITLQIHNRERIMQLLLLGEVDLVIMGRAPEAIDCVASAFATNPLGVICAPEHPLSRRRNAPPAILDGQVFVVRETGSGTRQAMERLFGEHGIRPRIAMEMPSNETIKQAVMAGMGMSFLSLRTVRQELASGHLVLVDIQGLPIVRHWHITHLAARRLSPAAAAFKDFIIEEAGALITSWA